MAISASDPMDEETPAIRPWRDKSRVQKAIEDSPKEAEKAKKAEEVLVNTEEPPQPTMEEEGNEENETPALRLEPEKEKELPPTPPELEVPYPTLEDLTIFKLPEEDDSQPPPLKESPVVVAEELLQEHLFRPVNSNEHPEVKAGWYYCLPETDLPGVQPPPLKPSPLSEPPPLTEATLPQPELFREAVVPPSSSYKDLTAPPITVPCVPELVLKQAMKEGSAAPVIVCTRPQRVDPVQTTKTTPAESLEDLSLLVEPTGTQSALANSIDSFMHSSVGQVFATTIDRALEKSEELLDYYLPLIDNKNDYYKAAEEKRESPEDLSKEGCFVRINSLSSRVHDRAFKLALHRLKMMLQTTTEKFSLLDRTLYLLEHPNALSISSVSEHLQKVWTELNTQQQQQQQQQQQLEALGTGKLTRSASILPEELELKALELTKILAHQLHSTYQSLLPHLADLPAHLQDKVIVMSEGMEEMQSHFSSSSLKDLPANFAMQCRQKLASARETLDELLDFIVSNPQGRSSQLNSSNSGRQLLSLAKDLQTKNRGESSTSLQPALPPPQP